MLLENEIIVDNFAGGGGASEGIEQALAVLAPGRFVDIAINHDPEAVTLHKANHPRTEHYCQSVWKADPRDVTKGRPVGLAWFSPDCKHFSKAKGGKPVEKKIRDLAWVVVHWAKLVKPRIIMLENVEEFRDWGPLIEAEGGKLVPCPLRKGLTFKRWVRELRKLGYVVEYRELRACDYGTPTIRKRLFLIARCDGAPIVWPKATHKPGKVNEDGIVTKWAKGRGLTLRDIQALKPWRTAAECIDWSLPCPSIFDRKKPLAEATLRRIARGIQRYVIEAQKPFIVRTDMTSGAHKNGLHDPDDPMRTQTPEEPAVVIPSRFAKVKTVPYDGPALPMPALGSGQCVWPVESSAQGHHFCGEPVDPGKPYCAEHRAVAKGAQSAQSMANGRENARRAAALSHAQHEARGPVFIHSRRSRDDLR